MRVTREDLLAVPQGTITETWLRQNINVAIGYMEAWLRGIGCVPLNHLMEDAATAEISRAQLWQWIRHGARLDDGRPIDAQLCRAILADEMKILAKTSSRHHRHDAAAALFRELIAAPAFPEFMTVAAYPMITSANPESRDAA